MKVLTIIVLTGFFFLAARYLKKYHKTLKQYWGKTRWYIWSLWDKFSYWAEQKLLYEKIFYYRKSYIYKIFIKIYFICLAITVSFTALIITIDFSTETITILTVFLALSSAVVVSGTFYLLTTVHERAKKDDLAEHLIVIGLTEIAHTAAYILAVHDRKTCWPKSKEYIITENCCEQFYECEYRRNSECLIISLCNFSFRNIDTQIVSLLTAIAPLHTDSYIFLASVISRLSKVKNMNFTNRVSLIYYEDILSILPKMGELFSNDLTFLARVLSSISVKYRLMSNGEIGLTFLGLDDETAQSILKEKVFIPFNEIVKKHHPDTDFSIDHIIFT